MHQGGQTFPGIVQNALARVATLFDTLFQTAEDAILLMDALRFADCNAATLKMFGCRTKEEIVGQTPIHFSPARQPDGSSSAEKAGALIAEAMDGRATHFDWRHRRRDGSEFDVEVSLNRCVVDGAPLIVAVVRDVTERKSAEAMIQSQMRAGELINRILSRCVGCVPALFDERLTESLEDLSTFLCIDHAYLFTRAVDGGCLRVHEWRTPETPSIACRDRDLTLESRFIEETLDGRELKRVDALDLRSGLPPDHPGAMSFLHVPTTCPSGETIGAIGVDSHTRAVDWSDADVLLLGLVGNSLTGLSDRCRAMARILEEKRFSERLIDSLPGIFYLYDSELRLRRWNANVETRSGYGPEELAGKHIGTWFAPEVVRRRVVSAAEAILARAGGLGYIEAELMGRRGAAVPYLLSGARLETRYGPMLMGVGIDIKARVEAERAQAASEREYRELFDATSDAIVVFDKEGWILEANARARAMYGLEPRPARTESISALANDEPPFSEDDARAKLQASTTEGPQLFEWRARRPDRSVFWTETAMRAFSADGQTRVIASMRDVTERKLAALERERLLSDLEAASNAKDQFLAVLSHELRNPLAAIQAGAGLLRRERFEDPRTARALDVIDRNVRLQARMVNDLLDLSRLTRGKLTLQRALVRLDEVVSAAVETCRADATRAGVDLVLGSSDPVEIEADSDRVAQIVINLVDNGIKFTPKGGRVTVRVIAAGEEALIEVADTGIGIEVERQPELFEIFRQGNLEGRKPRGLGIGLALVKSIAELHGGSVSVASAGVGSGTRFTVRFSRSGRRAGVSSKQARRDGMPKIRMLLVEDNDDTREMLVETLRRLRYEILPAASGEAALDILGHETVDVILADLGLPGIDGLELVRRAHELPTAAEAAAFALTGYGREADVERAREAGFVDHFVKPLSVEEIDRRIRSRILQG